MLCEFQWVPRTFGLACQLIIVILVMAVVIICQTCTECSRNLITVAVWYANTIDIDPHHVKGMAWLADLLLAYGKSIL